MKKKKLKFLLTLLNGFIFTEGHSWAGTCALCREVLRSGGSPNLIRGYYWSIVLIVSVPLIIIGVLFRFAFRAYQSKKV